MYKSKEQSNQIVRVVEFAARLVDEDHEAAAKLLIKCAAQMTSLAELPFEDAEDEFIRFYEAARATRACMEERDPLPVHSISFLHKTAAE
ncbi:MAG: hypothetical protein AAF439_10755 [Pseudomonadota bacterium]